MMDENDIVNQSEPTDVPLKWKKWFKMDRAHSAKWRSEAREDFDFVAGRQYSDEDEAALIEQLRPVITFNRTEIIIDAVSGNEIQNRNEIRYIPREMGDAIPNEIYTEAARWFDDLSDAADEDSEAFRDSAICGMGWTNSTLDFDIEEEGIPVTEREDPLSMYWDYKSVKANLIDARRLWKVEKMDIEAAMEMFPDAKKEDLDAGHWVVDDGYADPNVNNPDQYYEYDDDEVDVNTESGGKNEVTILHLQYWEWEDYYKVADPMQGKVIDLSVEEHDNLTKTFQKFGMQVESVKQRRKVFKQAFIGRRVLKHGPGPCAKHFSWNCMTAKRDNKTKTWYGLVRAMKDPQRWANKWLSQLLHIINSNAKGGLLIESGAVKGNIRDIEENWARADSVIELEDGAIGQNKIKERQMAQFPTGYQILTEFAIKAIREVSGVSLEMLGLREMNQPNVLENSRKQAGMAVLAPLFNSLRRYRRRRGMVVLYYIENNLADGRLIRIVGKDKEQYVPLLKQNDAKFDVIVDEAATSPNQKERVWEALTQILPGVKDIVPPQVLLQLLDYSPIPATVVAKIKEVVSAKSPEDEFRAQAELRAIALELDEKEANIAKLRSEAVENQSDTNLKNARTQEVQTKAPNEALKTFMDARSTYIQDLKPDPEPKASTSKQ